MLRKRKKVVKLMKKVPTIWNMMTLILLKVIVSQRLFTAGARIRSAHCP